MVSSWKLESIAHIWVWAWLSFDNVVRAQAEGGQGNTTEEENTMKIRNIPQTLLT